MSRENKTKITHLSANDFIDAIEHDGKRKDAKKIMKLMQDITGSKPEMWGPSIIGFGSYHYKYESGREGDLMKTGFSSRSTALTLYIMTGFPRHEKLMEKLGKFKTGKSCLYINKLKDIDEEVLAKLIKASWDHMTKKYG